MGSARLSKTATVPSETTQLHSAASISVLSPASVESDHVSRQQVGTTGAAEDYFLNRCGTFFCFTNKHDHGN